MTVRQQLSLLPVSIPDTVIDFLEGFTVENFFKSEGVRSAVDAEYLAANESALVEALKDLGNGVESLLEVNVEICTKEIPGAYIIRLDYESTSRGIGVLVKMKEKTIFKIVFQKGEYNVEELKKLLRNPT